jgi:hypothetical protein
MRTTAHDRAVKPPVETTLTATYRRSAVPLAMATRCANGALVTWVKERPETAAYVMPSAES